MLPKLQCWKGPVFTIKVLQKNTALKIWWDQRLVEIFCRAATRDWDRSSKYMSHLTTFINLPLSLFLPISSTYAMVSISSTGFFLAFQSFQPFTPPARNCPSTQIPSLPWCLAKVLPTAPRWEPNACSVHNWENKIPPESPHHFQSPKDSPNKKLCS